MSKETPKFELLVAGAAAKAEVKERIIAISVRQHLSMADAIEVRLMNDDLRFTESDELGEGKELAVKLGYEGEGEMVLVGTGTIIRRECEFPARGPAVVTVIAYDREFTLKHGTHTRAFLDVKDSDVVSQLVGDSGLTADVEDTAVTHKYLFQVAQTDLAYIRERALRLGFVVQVDRANAKLSFKKPNTSNAAVVTLTEGKDLLEFRPRFTTSDQVTGVDVRGWDMVTKAKVSGSAAATDLLSDMSCTVTGASRAQTTYGDRKVLYTPVVTSAGEAEQIAKAYLNQLLHTFAEGQAAAKGENKIEPGVVVTVDGVGKRAGGNYYVTSVLHHFEPKGYTTYFDFLRPSEKVEAPDPVISNPATPEPPEPPEHKHLTTAVTHAS